MDIKQAAAAYSNIAGITQNTPPDPSAKTDSIDASFSDLVTKALSGAVDAGHKAESVSTLALMGKSDITSLAVAVSSAEQALQTVAAIRDKVITAYQQIMQMPM